ncbi:MAG: alpha/beta hydrolase [Thermoplasmataceae archaeon]
MTLDPSMRNILEMYRNLNFPKLNEISIDDLREIMNNSNVMQESEAVNHIEDLSFDSDGSQIRCRLYDPKKPGNGLIIYFHGGGFIWGGIESSDSVCRRFANVSGAKVLSVDYRLAPEHKFPAAVNDGFNAFLWAYNNSTKLGIDREKIALVGDSSGGNIAASSCLKLKDNEYPLPLLQVLFYPFMGPDFFSESMREFSEGYFLTMEEMNWIGDNYLESRKDAIDPYFSPVLHENLKGLPEAIIVTAEYDPLRDQGEMYVSRLYSAGVPVTSIRGKGMIHGFLGLFSVARAADSIITMVFSLIGSRLNEQH